MKELIFRDKVKGTQSCATYHSWRKLIRTPLTPTYFSQLFGTLKTCNFCKHLSEFKNCSVTVSTRPNIFK